MVQKQSNFSRNLINVAKSGAYYTDVQHCLRIGKLFTLPDEVCVLEPCIGDARAVDALLKNAERDGTEVHLFGVEINGQTCDELRERRGMEHLLNADFLSEVSITSKAFSFCFCNPPYMATGVNKGERMEQRFVERIFTYMRNEGYLVLVVSYPTLCEEPFSRCLLSRFTCEGIWKFDADEYAKFKQIVYVGKRRRQVGIFASEYKRITQSFELENFPLLPGKDEIPSFRFEVPASRYQDIELFMESEFDPVGSVEYLKASSLYNMLNHRLFTEPYAAVEFGRPPLPLKKDLMYLAATAGGGQGVAGSEEEQDVHLQRGVAKVIEESVYEENDEGDEGKSKAYEKVRTRTEIALNIIENNGKISILK